MKRMNFFQVSVTFMLNTNVTETWKNGVSHSEDPVSPGFGDVYVEDPVSPSFGDVYVQHKRHPPLEKQG